MSPQSLAASEAGNTGNVCVWPSEHVLAHFCAKSLLADVAASTAHLVPSVAKYCADAQHCRSRISPSPSLFHTIFVGKRVLELGAGMSGFCSLVVATTLAQQLEASLTATAAVAAVSAGATCGSSMSSTATMPASGAHAISATANPATAASTHANAPAGPSKSSGGLSAMFRRSIAAPSSAASSTAADSASLSLPSKVPTPSSSSKQLRTEIVITDGDMTCVQNCQHIVSSNRDRWTIDVAGVDEDDAPVIDVSCKQLVWQANGAPEKMQRDMGGPFDVILMSDCLFFHEQHKALIHTIHSLLGRGGILLSMAPSRTPSMDKFLLALDSAVQDPHSSLFQSLSVSMHERYDEGLWRMHQQFLDDSLYDPNLHFPKLLVITRV